MSDNPTLLAALEALGQSPENPAALATDALLLARLDLPERRLEPYLDVLAALDEAMRAHGALKGFESATARAACLSQILATDLGFQGDTETYEAPENANLIHVIERRRGLPVALAVLYLHAARVAGWQAKGLSFPGHFLIQVQGAGAEDRALVDPFFAGQIIGREEAALRIRQLLGPDAELEDSHLAPVSDRALLLRLLNNLRQRAIQAEQIDRAAVVARRMALLIPTQADLWQDLADLEARQGHVLAAKEALEAALHVGDAAQQAQLSAHLEGLNRRLH